MKMWQDCQVRFDVPLSEMRTRDGELVIDKLDMIEDTKGNAGDQGRLVITNLRIMWHSNSLPRINLSIGFNTVVNITTKNVNMLQGNITQALYILTAYRSSKYEFIFTNLNTKSSRHYTSVIGVHRAYSSTKIYREIKLRGGFVHNKRLTTLPLETVYSTTPGVWNLSTEQGNLGTFVVTNLRVVWYADVNNQFNVSLPYLAMASANLRSSKFGSTLVLTSTEASGGYVLGFRVDPLSQLNMLHKEISTLNAASQKAPIFGVEYTFEYEAAAEPVIKEDDLREIQDNEDEISNVFGLYFAEDESTQRKPGYCLQLGLAAEEPREGSSLQSLWELLPAT